MQKERRWLNSVVKEAAKTKIDMPWARGARRAALIAKRDSETKTSQARA